jgi:hypothetical protein
VHQASPHVSTNLDVIMASAKLKDIGDPNTETVPDSEEERMR